MCVDLWKYTERDPSQPALPGDCLNPIGVCSASPLGLHCLALWLGGAQCCLCCPGRVVAPVFSVVWLEVEKLLSKFHFARLTLAWVFGKRDDFCGEAPPRHPVPPPSVPVNISQLLVSPVRVYEAKENSESEGSSPVYFLSILRTFLFLFYV